MDTDGWIGNHPRTKNVRMQYYTTSRELASNFTWLVQSLGGVARRHTREFDESDSHELNGHIVRHVHTSYTIDFTLPNGLLPARLPRKLKNYTQSPNPVRLIAKIESAGKAECQCISVDSPDHLYATNGFVLTHNTFLDCVAILDEAQNCTESQLKLFLTRMGDNAKLIIAGEDSLQTDIGPKCFLNESVEMLKGIEGIGIVEFTADDVVRHPLVSKILRVWEQNKSI